MSRNTIGVALALFFPALVQIHGFTPPPMLKVDANSNYIDSFLHDYTGQGVLPSLEAIQQLNGTNGTFLPLEQIQGDILVGMKKPVELFFFYSIKDAKKFKRVLAKEIYPHITTTSQLICRTCEQPKALLNVAWSSQGLRKLGVAVANVTGANISPTPLDDAFNMGQLSDASALGDNDPSKNWVPGFLKGQTDGAFLIASNDSIPINDLLTQVLSALGGAIEEVYRLKGAHRPGKFAGHEHFGFLDGISQPAIAGFSTTVLPGQSLVPPGIILTGEVGDIRAASRSSWMKLGSFLAFRQLQQFVPEFDNYLLHTAATIQDATRNLTERADLLGARMFCRWKSGTPTDICPHVDDPEVGSDPERNNNFDYNHPLPFDISANQSYCPFAGHARTLRPRADQANANKVNQIIRAGLPYGDEVTDTEKESNRTEHERGFAFVSYQSNIENGFRFQKVMWANNKFFPMGKTDPTPDTTPSLARTAQNPSSPLELIIRTPVVISPSRALFSPEGANIFIVPRWLLSWTPSLRSHAPGTPLLTNNEKPTMIVYTSYLFLYIGPPRATPHNPTCHLSSYHE